MKLVALIGTVGLASLAAAADPLPRTQVAADAQWVVHLDLDEFKQTDVGSFLMDELDRPEARRKLEAFRAVFNFDPRKHVSGLTLYGSSVRPEDGVLVMEGSFDPGRLATLAQAAKEYRSSQHGKHKIHSWIDEKRSMAKNQRTYAAIHGAHHVIFGQAADTVGRALTVMDGNAPSLETTSNFADLNARGGGFLRAATRTVEVPDSSPHSQLLRQATYLRLFAGESNDRISLNLRVDLANAEVASKIEQMAAGLIAMMSFQTDRPEAVKLAQAMQLDRKDKRINLGMELPSADVIEGIRKRAPRN